jgi:hypothetical protein
MKTFIFSLILFVVCQATFAQGISVQGIARNAEKAALVNQLMTFTFDIQDSEATSYYKENVPITTDLFGVFSHIIGTGNLVSGNFNVIPFGQTHMKLVITVRYNGDDIIITNSPFQYTPYAKSAENGVPTGTIVAFAGQKADVPVGWTLCDGTLLSEVPGSKNLSDLIGANAPDLKGMFLRGTGTSPINGQPGPDLNGTQQDAFKVHNHPGTTDSPGNHTHNYSRAKGSDNGPAPAGGDEFGNGSGDGIVFDAIATTGSGGHTHIVTTDDQGDNETRPVSYGVNYIIKL